MGQLGKGYQSLEPGEKEGAMQVRLHGDMALRIEAERCENSRMEDSRAYVDRLGVVEWVDGCWRQEDSVLVMVQSQWA